MTADGSPTLWLMADSQRRRRYPERLWQGDTLIEVSTDAAGENRVATIVDGDTWPADAPAAGPVLLSLDVLADSLRGNEYQLADRAWVPLLPADFYSDVAVARQRVAAGEIGAPRVVDVTVPVGLPPAGAWDVDHVCALTWLEALVFGMRAAELVGNATVESSTWLLGRSPVRTVMHTLDTGVVVVHHIVPADSTPTTAYEGVVLGESGRVMLRQQFAPGALGVWQPARPGYTFPAIYEAKQDVQAPDSVGGGWEMAGLLHELAGPGEHATQLREHAVRLVRHAIQLYSGGNDDH
ncbi:hypothetical protein EF847_14835 [Actinobacteria bacterium YIM 96077]|uniref:Uncharacterized protein n=1 Tax=Phytoactinopolyspora halophila TaxID=1981511 RepID=A0A329QTM7_9ACTN|nr:hypothetical protein [Phytoactinopolyspora halophila]AYY13779.1 hypothetical protein EF847_14835 [Actinobacteria bacterium YIM 96077]RAW15677.1 hypothetical protein DPM12_08505 [Phytoactinopolyspora halophila]